METLHVLEQGCVKLKPELKTVTKTQISFIWKQTLVLRKH